MYFIFLSVEASDRELIDAYAPVIWKAISIFVIGDFFKKIDSRRRHFIYRIFWDVEATAIIPGHLEAEVAVLSVFLNTGRD